MFKQKKFKQNCFIIWNKTSYMGETKQFIVDLCDVHEYRARQAKKKSTISPNH